MSKTLKLSAIKQNYPEIKVIYLKDINTHTIRDESDKCTSSERIQGKINTKNLMMEVRYIQEIHIRPVALILQSHIIRHETSTKMFMCWYRGAQDHLKGNNECCIHLPKQTEKKKNPTNVGISSESELALQ